MTYGVVRAFQVIVNTLESTEKAALYHYQRITSQRRREVEAERESVRSAY